MKSNRKTNVNKSMAALGLMVLGTLLASNRGFGAEPGEINRDQACEVLHQRLNRPALPTQRIVIEGVINPLVPPELRTQCTGTYDTGVPDPTSCSAVVDACGERREVCAQIPYCDFRGCGTQSQCASTCVPTTRTACSRNIVACNAFATETRFNRCEFVVTLRLPRFIQKPITEFVDKSYDTLESIRTEAATALPLECASDSVRAAVPSNGQVADAVREEIRKRLEARLRDEGERWLARTGIKTVLASIPAGGLGGVAALATSVGEFVETASHVADEYVKIKDTQAFAEDLDFSVSCGPGDWSRL